MDFKLEPKKNSNKYKLGEDQKSLLGSIMIHIPIEGHRITKLNFEVVLAHGPFLIEIVSYD